MRVFFASSIIGNKDSHNYLLDYLESKQQVFHYLHDLTTSNDQYSYNDIVEKISQADVFIAEMSRSSQTLGFQLAHALQLFKPCLYLYDSTEKGRPAGLIGNIPARGMKIKRYSPKSFKRIIDDFMQFAEHQMLTARTSFMSTREIDAFLSATSAGQGISKGELIRQILHKAMSSTTSSLT